MKRKKSDYNKPEVLCYIVLTVIFVAGVIYGVCSVKGESVLVTPNEGDLTLGTLIFNACIKNSRTLAWICVFSMSAAGAPVIAYLVYMKGYSLGTALYFTVLSAKCGVLKAMLLCFPELALNIAAFVVLSKYGLSLSFEIFKCVFGVKHKTAFQLCIRKFVIALVIALILTSLSGAAEILVRQIFT